MDWSLRLATAGDRDEVEEFSRESSPETHTRVWLGVPSGLSRIYVYIYPNLSESPLC